MPSRTSRRAAGIATFLPLALLVVSLIPHASRANEAHAERPPQLFRPCEHPYPCGDEWPEQLEGATLDLHRVDHLHVRSHDGTLLEGWVGIPGVVDETGQVQPLPAEVKVPVLLHSTPYIGDCYSGGCDPTPADNEQWWDETPHSWAISGWGVKPLDLVRMGYATAYFSVRGTGGSGGCFDLFGAAEATDQAVLVEYLAAREWANGRVAMAGNSYPATTAIEAAIADPDLNDGVDQVGAPSLKTIVVSGIMSDLYTLTHTPQGLFWPLYGINRGSNTASTTMLPPLSNRPTPERVAAYLGVAPERLCEGAARAALQGSEGYASDARDDAFYATRRLISRFPRVTSSVLLAHGLRDFGHRFQPSLAWGALENAPKRQLFGAWGHALPSEKYARADRGPYVFDPSWEANTWEAILGQWLAFWLKGEGVVRTKGLNPVPEDLRLDTVDYQDTSTLEWRESDSWPAREIRQEVMYLASESMQPSPGGSPATFRSAPNIGNSFKGGANVNGSPWRPWDALCPLGGVQVAPTSARYLTQELAEDVTVAGQPFLYLNVSSTHPGGAVAAALADLGPNFSCDSAGQPRDVRWLTNGGADLRFHGGNMEGVDFPVGSSTPIRVDLADVATTVEAGHRLVLTLSFGEPHVEAWTQPYYPEIRIETGDTADASHLVLPLVEGTLGGTAPTIDYPPRPFMP